MTVDDLINNALRSGGGVLDGSNIYAVVGDLETKELFTLNLSELFSENTLLFSRGETSSALLIAAYNFNEQAITCIESLREKNEIGPGVIGGPDWHILMSNPAENRLYSVLLKEYYVGAIALYQYKINAGNIPLGIFDSADAAENAIELIRYQLRKKD